jgi:hypothetical protein
MRVPFLEIPFFKAFATAAAFPVVALPIHILKIGSGSQENMKQDKRKKFEQGHG